MYNWISNQIVLILKTEWVVCTIGVPYKQYFAKMIKFNGLYFLYWSSIFKIQLLCDICSVDVQNKKLFILKTVGGSIVQLLHLGHFRQLSSAGKADRLRLVGGYIHAKGATFLQPPAIFNHFNNKIFLLENPVIIRINRCLTYSTILKILL